MSKEKSLRMPSVWDADEFPADGLKIQILTSSWSYVGAPDNDWSLPVVHHSSLSDVEQAFEILSANKIETPRPSKPRSLWESFGLSFGSSSRNGRGMSDDSLSCALNGEGQQESFAVLVAPSGNVLTATPDGSVTASTPNMTDLPEECIFRITRVGRQQFAFWSLSNQRYLRAMPDGSLLLLSMKLQATPSAQSAQKHNTTEKQQQDREGLAVSPALSPPASPATLGPDVFRVRLVSSAPKFIGVNLGGWLVAEAWMTPEWLFDGVFKDLLDGTSLNLQSVDGKWVAAEGGGGDRLMANRDETSAWETFYLRRVGDGRWNIRSQSGHYWSVDGQTGEVAASRHSASESESFWIRRKVGDDSKVQLRSAGGLWVRTLDDGSLAADIDEDAPPWNTVCTFTLRKVSDMGGEFQLGAALGQSEAATRLSRHRDEWVNEADFSWLERHGVNAVRIPVGWWVVEDVEEEKEVEDENEEENGEEKETKEKEGGAEAAGFVPGSLAYLDKAFSWASRHSLRVLLCLHALPGSQNGWEHSASRDGIPEWGREGEGHIKESLRVVEKLVKRYASHPAFAGFEPVNEPRADGVSFVQLGQYYEDTYAILRKHAPSAYFVIEGRIFANEREWDEFMTGPQHTNVIYDTHWYQVHDHKEFGGKGKASLPKFHLDYPKVQRKQGLKLVERGQRRVMVGEWSLALLCNTNDMIYTKFGKAQTDTYLSSSAGFFFWSLKHGQGWKPWSFKACVEKGWLKPAWWEVEKVEKETIGLEVASEIGSDERTAADKTEL